MRSSSRGGKRYIYVIVDDYSRFTWTLFLKSKNEVFDVFFTFAKQVQVKYWNKIVSIRLDHETEFENARFHEFYAEHGINHNFSTPKTPQQNSVVERKNRILEDVARTMLIASDIPKRFWVKTINTTCYVINRCMIRHLLEKTPYEQLKKFDMKSSKPIDTLIESATRLDTDEPGPLLVRTCIGELLGLSYT